MARGTNQKIKLLILKRLFEEQSDEEHVLSVKAIIAALERCDIDIERKTVYSDIEILKADGMDIRYRREKPAGYYLASRDFELPELKLLVDAVQASKLVTKKTSDELIHKLEHLTSHYEASQLQRQVYVTNRVKSGNENVFKIVDLIHAAISANVMVKFQYAEWTVEKKLQLKHGGAFYTISPWALTWDDENYYLVGYDAAAGKIKHFRVDKIQRMMLSRERREGRELFEKFDMAQYARQTFGMFHGMKKTVTLLCARYLVGVMIDRFGTDVFLHPVDPEHFSCSVTVNVSPQFFGWLAGLGDGVEVRTEDVRQEYIAYLEKTLAKYGD